MQSTSGVEIFDLVLGIFSGKIIPDDTINNHMESMTPMGHQLRKFLRRILIENFTPENWIIFITVFLSSAQ
ncbi:hypothetical protein PGTUg99_003403 [Puccinia graminis f. sp. tritici]|uniref:Uncharacterized protein n=1 Tax=Puccinia graminis f. sp. tritici TaxID=56615 RepID=A0A5B0RHM4_PUCGR|nr:hypothetical protein PGTUg99_003403 [Puccinia graminis f. sp. tritici]